MRVVGFSRLVSALAVASTVFSVGLAATPVSAGERPAPSSSVSSTPSKRATVHVEKGSRTRAVSDRLEASALGAGATGVGGTITFSEFSVGTSISRQYADLGIVFGGDSPFITTDGANPTSPVLSGTPRFQGTIGGRFELADGRVGVVDQLSLDVGYIDSPGSVEVVTFDARGEVLDQAPVAAAGIVRMSLGTRGIASFVVRPTGSEPAGFAIDNVSFPAVGPALGMPVEQTYGFGECNCFGAPTVYQYRTARPVNTATGADTESFTDIRLPGLGVPFELTRTYTSLDTTPGPLGPGWTHPYLSSLVIGEKAVTVRAEDGQRAVYRRTADGLARPAGVRARLAHVADGYLLTKPDQSTLRFDALGRLVEHRNRFGDGLSLTYADGELAEVTDSAGRTMTFRHDAGRLTAVTLPDGRSVEYGYTDGLLTTVRDLRGRTTTYAYDPAGRLASALDPNGNYLFRNTYDDVSGRVVSQLDPRGKETTFEWDAARGVATTIDPRGGRWVDAYVGNVLVERIDPLGNSIRIEYDDQLNVVAQTDARGSTTTMTYDERGNMLSRTAPAPLSYVEQWTYNADNNLLTYTDRRGNLALSNEYDADGLLMRSTDATGGVTRFTFDDHGLVRTVTDARGKGTTFEYDDSGNQTAVVTPTGERTTRRFDAAGRLVAEVHPRGNAAGGAPEEFTTTYAYDDGDLLLSRTDAMGRSTGYTYDDGGRLVSVTDATGAETLYGYNEDNQLTSETAPDGSTIERAYDDTGNLTRITDPAGSTSYEYDLAARRVATTGPRGNEDGASPERYTWTYQLDGNGNVISSVHPTAGTTTLEYDVLNRVVAVTDPLGRRSSSEYDGDSNVVALTDALGNVSRSTFDAANRQTSHTDALGNTTTYGYDLAGNRIEETRPLGGLTTWSFDDDGRMATRVDPRGNQPGADPGRFTTRFEYLPGGLLRRSIDPLGNPTTNSYDAVGNLVRTVDANGHETDYAYDELDRLVAVTAPGASEPTRYAYDKVDNLVRRTDAQQHVTDYAYDSARRLVALTRPNGTEWTFEYDAAGNQVRTVTGVGNATPEPGDGVVTRAYDPLDRLVSVDYSDETPDVGFEYDQVRMVAMSDGAGREIYAYDDLDRLTGVARDGSGFTYSYDAAGHLVGRVYPDGTAVQLEHDADGRPTALRQGNETTTFGYDAAGNLTTTRTPDRVVENRGIDASGRLVSVSTTRGKHELSTSSLSLDPVGNPVTAITARNGATTVESYRYDPSDRLVTVCYAASCEGAPGRIDYAYDGVGNRTTETRLGVADSGTRSYSYDPADQLVSVSSGEATTEYDFDANGNQTRAGNRTYAYDLAGRMVTAEGGAHRTDYTYDGQGRRLTRATDGVVDRRFTWDTNHPLPQLSTEADGAGLTLRDHLVSPFGDTLATSSGHSQAAYLHRDVLGNVTDVTGGNGRSLWEYVYEPFGATTAVTQVSRRATENPFRYQGQYLDEETGLYHLRARQYDPSLGRFTTTDPVTPPIDDPYVSAYVYAGNRPAVLADPSGRCSIVNMVKSWFEVSIMNSCEQEDIQTAASVSSPAEAAGASLAINADEFATGMASGASESLTWGLAPTPRSPYLEENPFFQAGNQIGTYYGTALELCLAPSAGAEGITGLFKASTYTAKSGWRVTDEVYALVYAPTKAGKAPAWSTVRARFWKNAASDPKIASQFSKANLERMRKGRAPQRYNPDKGGMESMELSHEPIPFRDGGTRFVPKWPQEHAATDPFRRPGY